MAGPIIYAAILLAIATTSAAAQPRPTLAMEGDSIMSLMFFPLKNLIGKTWNIAEFSVSGSTLAGVAARADSVDGALSKRGRNELLLWAGTNDGATEGDLAATTAGEAQAYLAARLAKGWKVTFIAMLPRTSENAIFNPSMDTFRNDYNFFMHTWCQANGVRFYDPTQNITGLDDYTNTTYYVDGVHPTIFALNQVAQEVVALIGATKK